MASVVALWPLIRELFINRRLMIRFISRNRLVISLSISCWLMFLLLLFTTEQAIRQEVRHGHDKDTITAFTKANVWLAAYKDKYDQCSSDLAVWQDNYRVLSKNPTVNTGKSDPVPTPVPIKNTSPNTAVLPPKDVDVALRKRLKEIGSE